MCTVPVTLQLRALRKLYAKAHQQLQEAGMKIIRLEDRITELEHEVDALRTPLSNHTEA